MALLPKKTYSKRNNDNSLICEKGKENVDPFDELLLSPLKQDVQFQPLSYWSKKVRNSKFKKKSEKMKYELYEISDSDEANSPYLRKKNLMSKNSVSKARIFQKKVIKEQYNSTNCKLSVKKDDFSTAYLRIKKVKSNKPVSLNENKILISSEVLDKNRGWSSNSTLYFNENIEETLISSSYNTCSNLKFTTSSCKEDFSKADYISDSNKSFNSLLEPFKCKKRIIEGSKEFCDSNNSNYLKFKMHENNSSKVEQLGDSIDLEKVMKKENSENITLTFDDSMEKTLSPFYENHNNHKFVSVKRHFNFPNFFNTFYENYNDSLKSSNSDITYRCLHKSWNESENSFTSYHLNYKPCENTYIQAESVKSTNNETYVYDEEILMDSSLSFNEYIDKTLSIENHTNPKSEVLKIIPGIECHEENTITGKSDFTCLSNTIVEDVFQEFLEQQNNSITVDGVADDSSSTTDDTSSEFKDKDSGIKVFPQSKEDDALSIGSDVGKEIIHFSSPSNDVSLLTTGISNLNISVITGNELTEVGNLRASQHYKNCKDEKKDSFLIDLRNITTKRRAHLNAYEKKVSCATDQKTNTTEAQNREILVTEPKLEQTFELSRIKNKISVDCDKSVFLANPLFESTRVVDVGFTDEKIFQKQINPSANMEETSLDHKFALKPGKKWLRSLSVLKQLQNRSLIEERLESTKITGKKFESFIQDIVEMQNDRSSFFLSSADVKVISKTLTEIGVKNSFLTRLSECKTLRERESSGENELKINKYLTADDSVLSEKASYTVLEKPLLNYTVKIIGSKDGTNYFKSALGLDIDRSLVQDNSIETNGSVVSARDFILMQCGQEDTLSFEEHFNERTLKNCKKIGEGVYGEVFMFCDSVIKIIPIEGSEKVNGEPQKTFEEIISEVVIASKLSNLRKGEKFRTDGFSELKRCWCVKGKYPKYLLKLWDEYDQLKSGSENDSPVMFKDDQLYIILELANGGKDLESFVFSSYAQSLSIFIQAVFSLAVAEKAYEFEHRDLHWGNVLISETQKKFMDIVLDNKEYKIPTKGVQVCIIDFTLSRINHEDCCIFNDLSVDPALFASEGDYQFEIYRMMLMEVKNDWSLFRPKTNLFWLHYLLDKIINMVHYKNKRLKVYLKHLKVLKTLESVVLDLKDSTTFALSESLNDAINKL